MLDICQICTVFTLTRCKLLATLWLTPWWSSIVISSYSKHHLSSIISFFVHMENLDWSISPTSIEVGFLFWLDISDCHGVGIPSPEGISIFTNFQRQWSWPIEISKYGLVEKKACSNNNNSSSNNNNNSNNHSFQPWQNHSFSHDNSIFANYRRKIIMFQ